MDLSQFAEAIFGQDYSPEEGVFSNHKVIIQVSYVCTPPWTECSPWITTCDEIEYTVTSNIVLLWSHPVIIESPVNTCELMAPITLTGPTVVITTGIVGTARSSATLVRVKVLLHLSL